MHPWFGQLTPEQAEALAPYTAQVSSSHAKTGTGAKGEIDSDTIRELHEIATRRRTPTKDPVMSIPEYVPSGEKLDGLHRQALFFLNGLHLNTGWATVDVKYVLFMGHRIYIVPNPGAGPDFMFEPWWKGEEEWEKRGTFANAYRAFEHVYFRVMRARIAKLVRAAK